MALPVLERTEIGRKTDSELKAYGKLSGGAEPADFTEEQQAMNFNARISENYQKLINPEYKTAEDFFDRAPEVFEQEEPVYESPSDYARATLYPERVQAAKTQQAQGESETALPRFEHQRVTEDIFRADSPINAPRMAAMTAEPVETVQEPLYETPVQFAQTQFVDETEEDLKPTATTIQYRTDLYREEQPSYTEEKKSRSMTAKGKLLMAVYSVVVVVILALIIINTSVLKTLDSDIAAKESLLGNAVSQAQELDGRIGELTDPSNIIERAESELGMSMKK